MLRMNFPQRKAVRRKEAKERQAERDKLSPVAQLLKLDNLLGKDVGAKKERARLKKLISEGVDTRKKD